MTSTTPSSPSDGILMEHKKVPDESLLNARVYQGRYEGRREDRIDGHSVWERVTWASCQPGSHA
jgi:hypothetical protein